MRLNIFCLAIDIDESDIEDYDESDYEDIDDAEEEYLNELNEWIESSIDDFVDRLIVEFQTCDSDKLDKKEYDEINDYITPLNIQQNDNRDDYPELDDFLTDLRRLHSDAGEMEDR